MRLLLDTNVLVSAIVAAGVSRRLFELWRRDRRFELIVCPTLLTELEDVLTRDRFARFITPAEVSELVAFLRTEADFVDDPADVPASTRDRDDDYLVAQRERVDALVSGDSDLPVHRRPRALRSVACWDPRALESHVKRPPRSTRDGALGDAARRVSPEVQIARPGIARRQIVGLRSLPW